MNVDIDGVLEVIADMAKQMALINGQLVAIRKHSDKQAAELAELRKAACASENVPD